MNYFDIGMSDYEDAKALLNIRRFNNASVLFQQACEKLLKSIAESVDTDDATLRMHKLNRINDRLVENEVDLNLSNESLSYLSQFYIDARYPGDEFILVGEDMCKDCLNIANSVVNAVCSWREEHGLYTTSPEEERTLDDLATF